ncbi:hypothetical protein SH1V18_23860 [Vallitalea longa]|uniref:HTH araC/xylS-type domain-containing protein n=1 Tax=Vallitalea longa TaxID=2936439 RepID=A0A9W5YC97_9FIRM|nr:AraC family transcriptional regulator [Vallitalea longa]GKX29906.1 hypothetical protein SH1V18_23860 [Vallitalea longa]
MDISSYKEKMFMYTMTTGLPISLYTSSAKLIHQINIPEIPFSFLGVFSLEQIIRDKKLFYNHKTNFEEYFISLRITSEIYNDLIVVVGPFKYKMLTNNEIKSIANQHVGKYRMVALQKYYYSLPIAKIGSINQHYKYLESLFNSTHIVFNDVDKDIICVNSLEKNIIEYREIDFYHHNYFSEKQYLNMMFKGRVNLYEDLDLSNIEAGTIANNYIRNRKNLCIINIGIFERYAIEQGLETHISFTIGDTYLRMVEECKNLSDIDIIMQTAFRKYKQALDLVYKSKYSKIINTTIKYINNNLSNKLSLNAVAKHVNVHPNYLSKLIKKELGMSFTDYILKEKIDESKLLLKYSNNSLSDITGILGFSSKSYFIKCFKKIEGITPGEYVKKHN